MKNKILVTGGCGFVGSNLVDFLIENQEKAVIVVDNLDTGKKENSNPKAEYIFDDIRNVFKSDGSVASQHEELLRDVDVIYHMAALARIQPSFKRPVETLSVNAGATSLICEFARRKQAKVVYAGSSSFYAGPYLNPYSFSKWQGEQICKLYSEVYDVSICIARFFNVYGHRHLRSGPYATVLGIFEHQKMNNTPLTITGNGDQRRDFTCVTDIIKGLISMSSDHWKAEIFNLGTGKNYSINEVAKMFKTDTVYIPPRPGEAWETLADIKKSQERLNYIPTDNLEKYVAQWLEG